MPTSLLLNHVDAWLFEQRSLVNARAKTLLPVLVQRQTLADHLTRLLDKLGLDRVPQKVGSEGEVLILMPDNGRDPQLQRTTNGQDSGIVKILPPDEFTAPKGDRDDDVNAALERFLGLR